MANQKEKLHLIKDLTRKGSILTPELQKFLDEDNLKRQKKARYMVERRLKVKTEKENQCHIPNEDMVSDAYNPIPGSPTPTSPSCNDLDG